MANINAATQEIDVVPDDGAANPQGGPGDKSSKVYLVTIPALKVEQQKRYLRNTHRAPSLKKSLDSFLTPTQRGAQFALHGYRELEKLN